MTFEIKIIHDDYLYIEGRYFEEGLLLDRLVKAMKDNFNIEGFDVSDDSEYFLYGFTTIIDHDTFLECEKVCNRIIGQWKRNHR